MAIFFNMKRNEKLSKHCSFNVGGVADIYVEPQNIEEFIQSVNYCKEENIDYYILGNGTNTIFTDKGFRGAIICTKKLCNIVIKNQIVCVDCGMNMFCLNKFLKAYSLGGLEWSYGIPGTIGGAVCMNAGAYGDEIKNYVLKVKVFDGKSTFILYSNELKMGYRDSIVKKKNLKMNKK